MPRTSQAGTSRRRRTVVYSESDDSSDEDITFAHPAASSSVLNFTQRDKEQHEVANRGTLANHMVKYFLNFSSTKIPVKRSEISKVVGIDQKSYPAIFSSALAKLEDIYGLTVTEVELKTGKVYLVHSNLPKRASAAQHGIDQRNEITLLFLCLSYIFMKNGEIKERDLFNFLERININDNENHEVFGDVGTLIRNTFPRQLYFNRTKVEIEGSNEPFFNISWGPRADVEFDKRTILEKVSHLLETRPAGYINQYNEAYGEDPVSFTQTQVAVMEIDGDE